MKSQTPLRLLLEHYPLARERDGLAPDHDRRLTLRDCANFEFVSWPVPATQPAGNVTILLSVSLPGKDEAYQRIVVPIQ